MIHRQDEVSRNLKNILYKTCKNKVKKQKGEKNQRMKIVVEVYLKLSYISG
jgi:hypothetical protein